MLVDRVLCIKIKVTILMNKRDPDLIAAAYLIDTMFEDILHKGHQQHGRNGYPRVKMSFKFDFRFRPDPDSLQRNIVVQELHLRTQRNGLLDTLIDKIPHD